MSYSKENEQRLYKGLSYEQYTISRLYSKGYEAHKLTADFGLDVEASKPYNKTLNKTYSFQIKSKYIKREYIIEKNYNAGTRKTYFIRFQIKQKDLKILLEQETSYLVCYITEKIDNENDDIWGEFWLNSKQLHYLKKQEYIDCQSSQEFAYINTFITTQADLGAKIDSCFNEIDKLLMANQNEIQALNAYILKLKKLIYQTTLLNTKSNMNVYITPEWKNEQGKQLLSRYQHNFSRFDTEPIPENPFIK